MRLDGKRVVITGASSGIGAELARQLAAKRCRLALAARRAEMLEDVAKQVRAAGGEAIAIAADVGDEASCRALIERAVASLGGLDVLVCNAGISMFSRFDEVTDLGLYERLMRVNYLGAVWCTAHALPHLKRARGAIVAVSSQLGKVAAPTRSGYCASKFAMQGFFDSLRIELAPDGVQVTIACPGIVHTDVRAAALGPDGKPRGESSIEETGAMSAVACAALILRAVERGKREERMTLKGRIAPLMTALAPSVVDRIASRTIRN